MPTTQPNGDDGDRKPGGKPPEPAKGDKAKKGPKPSLKRKFDNEDVESGMNDDGTMRKLAEERKKDDHEKAGSCPII